MYPTLRVLQFTLGQFVYIHLLLTPPLSTQWNVDILQVIVSLRATEGKNQRLVNFCGEAPDD